VLWAQALVRVVLVLKCPWSEGAAAGSARTAQAGQQFRLCVDGRLAS